MYYHEKNNLVNFSAITSQGLKKKSIKKIYVFFCLINYLHKSLCTKYPSHFAIKYSSAFEMCFFHCSLEKVNFRSKVYGLFKRSLIYSCVTKQHFQQPLIQPSESFRNYYYVLLELMLKKYVS